MRKLLVALLVGLAAWRLTRRRSTTDRVTVGWPDGSSITLSGDAPERDGLLAIAADVMR